MYIKIADIDDYHFSSIIEIESTGFFPVEGLQGIYISLDESKQRMKTVFVQHNNQFSIIYPAKTADDKDPYIGPFPDVGRIEPIDRVDS